MASSPPDRLSLAPANVLKKLLALVVLLVAALAAFGGWRATRLVPRPPAALAPDVGIASTSVSAERLREAVRFATVSVQDSTQWDARPFLAFHDWLRTAFPRVDSALTREVVNRHSLLYTWRGSDTTRPPILLTGHFDVVPVEPGTDSMWKHPPFAGDTADGYLWGRGTTDDKASVIGVLEGVDLLVAQGFAPTRTVLLAFGHDEEVGGQRGAGEIARLLEQRYGTVAFLVDEGGIVTDGIVPGVKRRIAMVGVAEKSSLSVELSVTGAGGHSSMPPDHTALGILARALTRLEEHQMPARLTPATEAFLTNVASEGSFAMRVAFANLALTRPLIVRGLVANPQTAAVVRTTTAVTMASGSPKENVLPIRATAVVNFRILPGDSVQGVLAHVARVVGDTMVKVRPLGAAREPSPVAPFDTPEFATLERTIGQLYPDALATPYLLGAATDTRHYEGLTRNIFRFMPVVATPALIAGAHGTNERVPLADFTHGVKFWAQLIRNAQ
ncbi:MAG TPA: M20 family peptidase [Gemmatimonadaceae bacterium]|nr:M20 family peptidase [Gemmatimonadaceae bacterium]